MNQRKTKIFEVGDIIENIKDYWATTEIGDKGKVIGMMYVKDKDRDDWLLTVRWLKNNNVSEFYAPYAKRVRRKDDKPVVKKSTGSGWGFD